MIGIIGAMKIEVDGIIKLMDRTSPETISGITYTTGILNGHECVVATSGIGKVNSAVCTQTMILKYNPKFIINTGVAGGISNNVKIGDVVVAKDVIQHDIDTTAFGDPKGMISGINIVNIPCSEKLIEKVLSLKDQVSDVNFNSGTIVTGDQFINSRDVLSILRREFNSIACEMEGGSIGQVCYINGVEFVVIRTISDNSNDDSHMDYNTFLNLAAERSISILSKFLSVI